MSNWLLKLLGVDSEAKKQRQELKKNLDEADAKLEAMKRQLAEMGQASARGKSDLSKTLSGLHGTERRTAQGS